MSKILVTWAADSVISKYNPNYKRAHESEKEKDGFTNLLKSDKFKFDKIVILYQKVAYGEYIEEVKKNMFTEHVAYKNKMIFEEVVFKDTDNDIHDFERIQETVTPILENYKDKNDRFYFLFNSGTTEMRLLWIILSQTKFPGIIVKSNAYGIKEINLPESIKINLMENIFKKPDESLLGFDDIIGNSPEMDKIKKDISKAAKYPFPIMLYGETGVGKTVIANAIHKASGRTGNFIKKNCGAIPESLIEAELFGIVKGASTGVDAREGAFLDANKGTIFLDEIGEMPLEQQVKLLKVIDEKEVIKIGTTVPTSIDVLIIVATNRDLKQLIKEKKFRLDLYFRLNTSEFTIPSLKKRREDIVFIAEHFLDKLNKDIKKYLNDNSYKPKVLSDEVKEILKKTDWSGNVRELENVLKKTVINMEYDEFEIRKEHLRYEDFSIFETAPKNLIDLENVEEYFKKNDISLIKFAESVKKDIVEYLIDKGLKQKEIASLLRIAQPTISRILNPEKQSDLTGEYDHPS